MSIFGVFDIWIFFEKLNTSLKKIQNQKSFSNFEHSLKKKSKSNKMVKMNGKTNLSFGACVIIAVMEFMYMISGKNVLILESGIATPIHI